MSQTNPMPRTGTADTFDIAAFAPLSAQPTKPMQGQLSGVGFTAQIAIPHYDQIIAQHYKAIAPTGLGAVSDRAEVPFDLPNFGLRIAFDRRVALPVHDLEMNLDHSIRALVAQFGAVFLTNACISGEGRLRFHRNIFPHLKFHVDRGPTAPNQYSCFTRDPDDAAQQKPRESSTVFIANLIAWLEAVRSGRPGAESQPGLRPSYELFQDGKASKLFGKIILEQPWDAPAGTGEIAIIDNRTAMHATYDKKKHLRGYPIGARYLT